MFASLKTFDWGQLLNLDDIHAKVDAWRADERKATRDAKKARIAEEKAEQWNFVVQAEAKRMQVESVAPPPPPPYAGREAFWNTEEEYHSDDESTSSSSSAPSSEASVKWADL